jgi:hypothetical protein
MGHDVGVLGQYCHFPDEKGRLESQGSKMCSQLEVRGRLRQRYRHRNSVSRVSMGVANE